MAFNLTDKNDCDEIQVDEIRGQLSEIGFINRLDFNFNHFRNRWNSISNHLLYFDFFNFSKKFKLKTNLTLQQLHLATICT